MSLATVLSRAAQGIHAPQVTVEVHLSNGLPGLSIVGLPETAVKESKDRVRAALLTSQFSFPARRITVNLAPADLPKEGGRFDLPIALGMLIASGQLPQAAATRYEFLGELSLSGELRAVRGALAAALQAVRAGHDLILPAANAAEAALIEGLEVIPARDLLEVCAHLTGTQAIAPQPRPAYQPEPAAGLDLADVRGHHRAKRALEVAATGSHNLLMIGPPGTGKTMLASRLPTLLPPLTEQEAIESATVHSVSAQGFDAARWRQRPFRAPHHTASGVALVGGGSMPLPGEISLAHHGVLFLDELTEFNRRVLEVLREPLEAGRITISRAARQAEFPAQFQLIAAMNPCPRGYDCDLRANCSCTPEQQARHRARLSAPLLDRIDLHVEVLRQPQAMLKPTQPIEASQAVRARVYQARDRQLNRQGKLNAHLTPREVEAYCPLTEADGRLLDQAITRFGLSTRAYHRILKVARTIADLAESGQITTPQVAEAISYRALDRAITRAEQR